MPSSVKLYEKPPCFVSLKNRNARKFFVKKNPAFAGQARDAECVDAANRQARAAQETADNTYVMLVSAVNSFGRK